MNFLSAVAVVKTLLHSPFTELMEAFQLLSRGGARFDKGRFKKDVLLFNVGTVVLPSYSQVTHSADLHVR